MSLRKDLLIVIAAAGCGIGSLLAADQPLLWEREIPLREPAKSIALTDMLNATSPLPSDGSFGGAAVSINNLKMRTTLWGPPDRVTISIKKNNVWDLRIERGEGEVMERGNRRQPFRGGRFMGKGIVREKRSSLGHPCFQRRGCLASFMHRPMPK